MGQTVIWRDKYDKDMYYIGTKNGDDYIQYVSCFIDGLKCLGLDWKEVEHIKTKPIAIKLVAVFP